MAETCGTSCAKFMLFVFNILFFLSGAALLGVGIWLLVSNSITPLMDVLKFANDNTDQMRMVAYILIGIGAFIFIVGFFGCCGAVKMSKCMLGIYIFLLLIVMGVEIAAGVLALIFKDQVKDKVENDLKRELIEDHYYNSTEGTYYPFGIAFNFAQKEFTCCGVDGPDDYLNSTFKKNNPSLSVPYSCCKLKDDAKFTAESPKEDDVVDNVKCQNLADTSDNRHKDGCKTGIIDWANTKLVILIGVGLGIAALELFGFIFAVCLCRNISPDKQ